MSWAMCCSTVSLQRMLLQQKKVFSNSYPPTKELPRKLLLICMLQKINIYDPWCYKCTYQYWHVLFSLSLFGHFPFFCSSYGYWCNLILTLICFIMSLQLNLQDSFKSQHALALGLRQPPFELRVYLTVRQTGTALGLWTQSRPEMHWWNRAGWMSRAMKLQNVTRCKWK